MSRDAGAASAAVSPWRRSRGAVGCLASTCLGTLALALFCLVAGLRGLRAGPSHDDAWQGAVIWAMLFGAVGVVLARSVRRARPVSLARWIQQDPFGQACVAVLLGSLAASLLLRPDLALAVILFFVCAAMAWDGVKGPKVAAQLAKAFLASGLVAAFFAALVQLPPGKARDESATAIGILWAVYSFLFLPGLLCLLGLARFARGRLRL